MEINVVDTVDPGLMKVVMTLRNLGQKVVEIPPGNDAVHRMVDAIIRLAGSPSSITVLRLYAHGSSGAINVAGGEYSEEEQLSTLTLANLPKLETTLRRLSPYFASGARVELQGCSVATGTDGEKFILGLARVWGVRVQARPKGCPLGTVQFQGAVYEANPQGGLICVPGTEITRQREK